MNIDALRTAIGNEPPLHLIEELAPGSAMLRSLTTRFSRVSARIPILGVFETQKTATVVFDVSKTSNVIQYPETIVNSC
jgi:hypothetical protein